MIQGIYRHYKGGYYFVFGIGFMSEARTEQYVIYWSFSKWMFWLRPSSMFFETLGTGQKRFKKII